MAKWINRTVVDVPADGTGVRTIKFPGAQAGSLLVAIITSYQVNSTPSGWTKYTGASAGSDTGLYYKTATAGESSLTTIHSVTGYNVGAIVYEFGAGSVLINAVGLAATANTATGPSLSSIAGQNLIVECVTAAIPTSGATYTGTTWSTSNGSVEDVDVGTVSTTTASYIMSTAIIEDSALTSVTGIGTITGTNLTFKKEILTFAVNALPFASLAVDTFTGTSGATWASQWSLTTASGAVPTLSSGTSGRMNYPTVANYAVGSGAYLTGMPLTKNVDVLFDVRFSNITPEQYFSLTVRVPTAPTTGQSAANSYELSLYPANGAYSGGVNFVDSSGNSQNISGDLLFGAFTANVFRRCRFQVNESTLRVKMWDIGSAEPTAWTWSGTHNLLTQSGRIFFRTGGGYAAPTSAYVLIDNLYVTDPSVPLIAYTTGRLLHRWNGTALVAVRTDRWTGSALVQRANEK